MLFDAGSLIKLIPGCRWLEQVSPGNYHGQIQLGVAAVGGAYEVSASVAEQQAPDACRFEGRISGPTGAVTGDVALRLKEVRGITLLDWEVRAMITGGLATIPSRLVEGVARTLIDQGLSRLNEQLKTDEPDADDAPSTR
jgi:hypothetical protein